MWAIPVRHNVYEHYSFEQDPQSWPVSNKKRRRRKQQRSVSNAKTNDLLFSNRWGSQHLGLKKSKINIVHLKQTNPWWTIGLLDQPSNVVFTGEAQRVGALLFQIRSLQVTGVQPQNQAEKATEQCFWKISNNNCICLKIHKLHNENGQIENSDQGNYDQRWAKV